MDLSPHSFPGKAIKGGKYSTRSHQMYRASTSRATASYCRHFVICTCMRPKCFIWEQDCTFLSLNGSENMRTRLRNALIATLGSLPKYINDWLGGSSRMEQGLLYSLEPSGQNQSDIFKSPIQRHPNCPLQSAACQDFPRSWPESVCR